MRGANLRRRDVILAGLAAFAGAVSPRALSAAAPLQPFRLVPDGERTQTAALQAALDVAARTNMPFFLPPGTYKTGRLVLRSGTHVQGVPGHSILLDAGGQGGLFEMQGADKVRLSGLTLDGGHVPFGNDAALLAAIGATNLDIDTCRFVNGSGDGVSLKQTSGRIAHCRFEAIAGTAVSSQDATVLDINRNVVDTAATGIAVTGSNQARASVRNNRVRNLYQRKIGACGGVGIHIAADCRVTDNVIEGAPAYGILVGTTEERHDVTVRGNVIRRSHIGIGVPEGRQAGRARLAENRIEGTNDGGIRAMKGPRPVGPDLTTSLATDFHANLNC